MSGDKKNDGLSRRELLQATGSAAISFTLPGIPAGAPTVAVASEVVAIAAKPAIELLFMTLSMHKFPTVGTLERGEMGGKVIAANLKSQAEAAAAVLKFAANQVPESIRQAASVIIDSAKQLGAELPKSGGKVSAKLYQKIVLERNTLAADIVKKVPELAGKLNTFQQEVSQHRLDELKIHGKEQHRKRKNTEDAEKAKKTKQSEKLQQRQKGDDYGPDDWANFLRFMKGVEEAGKGLKGL